MAQQPSPPNILNELPHARSSERKIEILLQACREIQYSRPEEAFGYAEQAQKIARKAKLRNREVHCMRMCGICLFAGHDYVGALNLFSASMAKYQKIKDLPGQARAMQNIGMAQRAMGKTDEAIHSYKSAETLTRKLSDRPLLMIVLNNIGSLYSTLVRPKEALEAYSECLTLAERLDDVNLRARLMGNIADVYQGLGDLETGIEWSKRSLELHRANADVMGVGLTLSNLGRIHKSQGNLDAALAVLSEALTVMSELPDQHAKARIMIVLSGVLLEKRFTAQAETMATDAANIFHAAHDVERELGCLIMMAEIARKKGNAAEAEQLLKRSKKLAATIENPVWLVDIEHNWAQLAEVKNDVAAQRKHLTTAVQTAGKHSIHSTSAGLHRELSALHAKEGDFKTALKHERLASEAQQLADKEIRSRHSQALQLQIEVERMSRDRERIELQSERLAFELESKERELNANALSIAQKNELLSSLSSDLDTVVRAPVPDRTVLIKDVIRRIENHRRQGEDWKNFAEQLKDVHDGFLQRLAELYPTLTATEIKMCSLLKLNLNSKEIAELLTIELSTVEVYRHRLRKKLSIPSATSIAAFMQTISK